MKRIAVETVLLATDLDACRDFYEGSLELPVVATAATSFTVQSGTSRIRVSRSTTGTRDQQTKCIWTVPEVRAVVTWLAMRDIDPLRYNGEDGIHTDKDGIAAHGSSLIAWIQDPAGNTLGIQQPT